MCKQRLPGSEALRSAMLQADTDTLQSLMAEANRQVDGLDNQYGLSRTARVSKRAHARHYDMRARKPASARQCEFVEDAAVHSGDESSEGESDDDTVSDYEGLTATDAAGDMDSEGEEDGRQQCSLTDEPGAAAENTAPNKRQKTGEHPL